jgi:hypothetical protein
MEGSGVEGGGGKVVTAGLGGVVTALVAGVGVGDEDDQGVAMRTWGAGPTTTRAGVGRTSAQWDGQ